MRYFIHSLLLLILLLAILNAVPFLFSRSFIYERQEEIPQKEVGLVLGAGLTPDGEPSLILKARLNTALTLYRAKKIQKLVLSGDSQGLWYDEVRAMKKYLLARGVKSQDLLLDPEGHSTFESMCNIKKRGIHTLIVFTQQYHLPRAVYVARAMNIDAVGFVSDQHISPDRWWYQWRELWARPMAVYTVLFMKSENTLECFP